MFVFSFLATRIYFESSNSIQVNDTVVTIVPAYPIRYPTFTIYRAGLFIVINGTHFILRWDHGEIR